MELSGEDRKELRAALISAYPKPSTLEMMVSDELDLNLGAIASSNDDLETIIFQLIKWAESQGKIEDLIEKSHRANFNNQQLKAIRNRLIPKLSNNFGTSTHTISNQQWKELASILSEIDLDVIAQVCRLTLENLGKNKDVLGNYPEIIEMRILSSLRTILLEKCPLNNQKKPTVLEFAERLNQEKKIEESSRNELNQWVKILAEELNIEIPTYNIITCANESSIALQSYLLITVIPVCSNTFRLVAELIPNYQDFANQKQEGNCCLVPIELSKGEVGLECSLTEVPDTIYKFINASRVNYLSQYEDYDLTVELFLPLPYLGSRIDLEDIPIGFDRRQPIGCEHRFVVRSLDRITVNGGEYRMRLSKRWKKITKLLQISTHEELQNYFECFSTIDRTWNELAVALQEKFVLNVRCGLPESDKEKEELFIAMLRGGIPITLWSNYKNFDDLEDIDIENELEKIVTKESLTQPSYLFEQVWKLRQKVYSKKEKCLEYHIGFICDHPN